MGLVPPSALLSLPSGHPKTMLEWLTQQKAAGLTDFADNIGLKTGNTRKAIESSFMHIGSNSKIFPKILGQNLNYE